MTSFNQHALAVAQDFPLLQNNDIAYLDSAATSLMPKSVLDAMHQFTITSYSNVHRGIYNLAARATQQYEGSRKTLAKFFGCSEQQVIITRGCTDALNMLYASLFEQLTAGDEVITSVAEHHSSFVPLQQHCIKKGCILHVVPLNNKQEIDMSKLETLLSQKTKLVSLVHVSNVLGSTLDTQRVHDLLVQKGIRNQVSFIVDGAQSAAHLLEEFPKLNIDFFACSAHKMYGPTGVGVLIGRLESLQQLSPSRFGGEMVDQVTLQNTTWGNLPLRLEPGTPPIVQAVGFAAAIQYIQKIGKQNILSHESALISELNAFLQEHAIVYGPQAKHSCVSFNIAGIHAHDVAAILDEKGVCIRAGNLCAQPLLQSLQVDSVVRASVGIYNTLDDIERFKEAILFVKKVFS